MKCDMLIDEYSRFTFDDVLIVPSFSDVCSRLAVNLASQLKGECELVPMSLPIMSANMKSVTGVDLAVEIIRAGGMGCLHRFSSIEENVNSFLKVVEETSITPFVSFGLGAQELERAEVLYRNGARRFILDVAHGAQSTVVEQYLSAKYRCPQSLIVVGNFATGEQIKIFERRLGKAADAYKVGIGPGSVCLTRIKTGCGYPQLSAIYECSRATLSPIIADGGVRSPGDVAKALAAGAAAVMMGGQLARTREAEGENYRGVNGVFVPCDRKEATHKLMTGSAYKDNPDEFRASEGDMHFVPIEGNVKKIMDDIAGGLRSAFTYVGANSVSDFQTLARFIRVTSGTVRENGPHGREKST